MSLKARIEAVIYAAEEPVTLAALASLFREEALSARAERLAAESAVSEPAPGAADEEREAEPAGSEIAAQNSADAEVATPDFAGEAQPVSEATAEESVSAAEAERQAQPAESEAAEPEVPQSEAPQPDAAAAQEDEKKAQRQRDREARDEIRRLVDELMADYAAADSGLEMREVAGGFRLATRPEYHDAVRAFIKSLKPPMKLSLQALETLAVIAYKQPVTAPEIGEIRGVDSGGVLGSLIARKLVTTAGRKQVIGRPILYKTTKEFLLRFGLKDLNELPSMEEFEKMAGELADAEAEEEAAPAAAEELPFAEDESVEQAAEEIQQTEAIGESEAAPASGGSEQAEASAVADAPSAEEEPREAAAADGEGPQEPQS